MYGWTERWSGNSPPIAVGGTYTGTRNITLPTTTTGNRYLLFITDQYANYSTTLNNRQGETNENDNIFALPINISSADLVLESAISLRVGASSATPLPCLGR
jgi:hypothetical protein